MSTTLPDMLSRACAVPLPVESGIAALYEHASFADAFEIVLPAKASVDAQVLAHFVFAEQAPWIGRLMQLRDSLVTPFGLKTSKHLLAADSEDTSPRLYLFKIYASSAKEMVLGEDDWHLDFRASVLCRARGDDGGHTLVLTTVVQCHNALGRLYIRLIAPFHRMVVKSALQMAAARGWP